ncbi:alpha/beta fold hydrolase [Leptospira santarosai]|uniref:alpha/beta fold hydrolase n=1 Tax=Leptospira santarosai TaxID=28183 RepID=UPI0003173B09|nr:alpha/beta hydrolase [Leptospira santarosai]
MTFRKKMDTERTNDKSGSKLKKIFLLILVSVVVLAGTFEILLRILLPLSPDPEGVDLFHIPGPWENSVIELPNRNGSSGFRVHYLSAGSLTSPVVVLLHGFPDTSYGWRYVIPLLSKRYRVLIPDLRGYAGTDKPENGYDLRSLSEDLFAFVENTNKKENRKPDSPVHVVGHDWGASIVWFAIAEKPQRFRTATVLDIPHPNAFVEQMAFDSKQREYRYFVYQLIAPRSARLLAGLSRELRARIFYRNELQKDAALRDSDIPIYHAAFNTPEEMRGPLEYYRELAFHGDSILKHFKTIGPIQVDTLVLWGAKDNYMTSEMAALSCKFVKARCEFEIYPNSGHWLQWEEPVEVFNRWQKFIEK